MFYWGASHISGYESFSCNHTYKVIILNSISENSFHKLYWYQVCMGIYRLNLCYNIQCPTSHWPRSAALVRRLIAGFITMLMKSCGIYPRTTNPLSDIKLGSLEWAGGKWSTDSSHLLLPNLNDKTECMCVHWLLMYGLYIGEGWFMSCWCASITWHFAFHLNGALSVVIAIKMSTVGRDIYVLLPLKVFTFTFMKSHLYNLLPFKCIIRQIQGNSILN